MLSIEPAWVGLQVLPDPAQVSAFLILIGVCPGSRECTEKTWQPHCIYFLLINTHKLKLVFRKCSILVCVYSIYACVNMEDIRY